MKNVKKIELQLLRDRLQNRMHYDYPDFAFDVLLYGWCKFRKHSKNWLSDVKRRGWLSLEMARDFSHYCGHLLV